MRNGTTDAGGSKPPPRPTRTADELARPIGGRLAWVAGAAGLLLVAGLIAGLLTVLGGPRSPAAGNAPAARLTSAQRLRLERGLTAPGIAAEATAVAAEVRSPFVSRGRSLLPRGSRLLIDAASFHATSADAATVDAVVSGPDPGRWQLLLIREGGQWLLIDSRKLP